MKRKIDELVVRPRYSSRRRLFIAGLSLLVFIVIAFMVYDHGLTMAGFDRTAVSHRQQQLNEQIAKLNDENQSLRESLSRAQLAIQMNQASYQELDRTVKASAQETLKLREELDFYRNIISPANKTAGLQIQRLDIVPGASTEQFRYKLVLIQALKHDRNAGGHVRFELNGEQDGKPITVTFPDGERGISVNFKYFQDLEGSWRLPAGFKPKTVTVRVSTNSEGRGVEQTFDWPRAG